MEKIMKYFWPIAISVVICLIVGAISGHFQSNALIEWYPYLQKSSLTPPDFVFPIAWSIIYLCMGASIGLAWYAPEKEFKPIAKLFVVQLLLNFLWSLLFFTMQSPVAGFLDILVLDAVVIIYIVKSYKTNRASALLFVPYIAWLIFATYLNGYIMIAN